MYHGTPAWRAAALESELAFLASRFDVVPLSRIHAPAGARRRLALTFDDGLRNNVTVAYPILRRLGLPATFFVCPGLVNRRRWLWNHEARERLRALEPGALRSLAGDCGAPAGLEPFVDWMKTLRIGERERIEELVRLATPGFAPGAAQREAFDIATWDELRTLDPRIVTIGSHTMTHPILPSVSHSRAAWEMAESRRQIEDRLGRPATLFCYPNGDLDEGAVELARAHYDLAVTVEPGGVRPGADRMRLPRWAAPRGVLRLARVLYPWPRAGWLALSAPTRRAATLVTASFRTLSWIVSRA